MKKYLNYVLFWIGIPVFLILGITPKWSYIGFRRLFYDTKGRFNDKLSKIINLKSNKLDFARTGLLGKMNKTEIEEVVTSIQEDGYYVFKEKVSEEVCKKLVEFTSLNECNVTPSLENNQKVYYDKDNLLATKYGYSQQDLICNETVQRIITDEILIGIAQEYLGCRPINDTVGLWWSTAFSKIANSKVAQLFHNDMDRIKFLKFFIYLTDVTLENGPHVYVKGSHSNIKDKINRDGRFSDEDIIEEYGEEKIINILGNSGTIMVVDTRGLHKGLAVKKGHRLLFSMEFCNSLFGAPYETLYISKEDKSKYAEKFAKFNSVFSRITVS